MFFTKPALRNASFFILLLPTLTTCFMLQSGSMQIGRTGFPKLTGYSNVKHSKDNSSWLLYGAREDEIRRKVSF